jgi:hypothetical protein
MMATVSSKRANSSTTALHIQNVNRHNVPRDNKNYVHSRNCELFCKILSEKPNLNTQRFKPKKQSAKEKSNFKKGLESHACKVAIPDDIHQPNPTTSPLSQSLPHNNPCEHILNTSPLFYGSHGRDILSQSEKQHVPTKHLFREASLKSHCKYAATPSKLGNIVSGFGCHPKAERVSVASNSKADSCIYKNVYKSLIVSNDVNRMPNLQKAKESLASSNSPSRLKELMKSKPQNTIMRLTSAKYVDLFLSIICT